MDCRASVTEYLRHLTSQRTHDGSFRIFVITSLSSPLLGGYLKAQYLHNVVDQLLRTDLALLLQLEALVDVINRA